MKAGLLLVLLTAVACGGSSGVPVVGNNVLPPTASPSPAVEIAAPVLTASPKPAASCTVSTKSLGAGQARSCQFIATARGGAEAFFQIEPSERAQSGAADVFVTRAGDTTRHDVYHTKALCLQDFIQPGDRVIVTVRQASPAQSDLQLRAGAGMGCI